MTKSGLRLQLKALRQNLTPVEVETKSQAIFRRVVETVSWDVVRSVHCYISINNEVDTQGLVKWMRERRVQVTHPGRIISPEELAARYDLIIVPVLGFDTNCHRLGYGGGFYDRLLAAQPQAQTVGLAYDLSLVSQGLPIEPHDVALRIICTETAVFMPNI